MSAPGTLDLAGIRARAEAATKGDWFASFVAGACYEVRNWTSRMAIAGGMTEVDAAHAAGMDPPTTIALVNEVERLTGLYETAVANRNFYADERKAAVARIEDAEAEATKLRARVAELEGAEEAAESAADEDLGQAAADKAVMSLEAMAFNWIATTDIHKAIAAASRIAGPYADKLGSCIHGLVSQAWIEGANTGFNARRKLTVAAREQIAELERMHARE